MKECFLITSYCDTQEKMDILISTIDSLKKYNIDICIHAHYPLDAEIQSKVNHYLYDITNPIIPLGTRSIIMWRKFLTHQLNVLKHDYGSTVIYQIRNGSLYLYDLGYDIIHVVNYDTIVSDELLLKIKQSEIYDGVFFLLKEDETSAILMSYNMKKYLPIIESMSVEDYISMNEYWYAEKYIFNKFYRNNLYLNDFVDSKIRHQPHEFERYERNGYYFHAGERILWENNEKKYTNIFEIFFYNIQKPIHLKLCLDGEVFKEKLIIDTDPIFVDTGLTMDDIYKKYIGEYVNGVFIKQDHEFKLYINGELIEQDTINTFCLSAIEHDLLKNKN